MKRGFKTTAVCLKIILKVKSKKLLFTYCQIRNRIEIDSPVSCNIVIFFIVKTADFCIFIFCKICNCRFVSNFGQKRWV